MKKINPNRMENSQEQTFNFDLNEMKASIESGVMNMPRGLTGQERREWVLKRLKEKGVQPISST
jgi:hypothetical protein